MPVEPVNPNSRPDSMNKDWPLGDSDDIKFGFLHLRNLKTVIKNFFNDFKSYQTKVDGRFDAGYVKEALDADQLAGLPGTSYLNVLDWNPAAPPEEKLPAASLSEEGVLKLDSSTNSLAEHVGATPKAVKAIITAFNDSLPTNDLLVWNYYTKSDYEASIGGTSTAIGFPIEAEAALANYFPIEFRCQCEHYEGGQPTGVFFTVSGYIDPRKLPGINVLQGAYSSIAQNPSTASYLWFVGRQTTVNRMIVHTNAGVAHALLWRKMSKVD